MRAIVRSGEILSTVGPVDAECTSNHSTRVRSDTCYDQAAPMNLKRTASVVIVGGACAAWLAAATAPHVRESPAPTGAAGAPRDARAERLASDIARLQGYLRPGADLRPSVRNPFRFAAARPPASPRRATTPAVMPTPPVMPPSPSLKLSGMAEDAGPNGPVRTAIVSGMGQLFLVREGDTIAARYHVLRIGSDVIELTDMTGTVFRLGMK
jgi:hypothetical protein